ncbi:MAG: hypothetical protein DLM64_09310 [Solirubrobacterales bacterium]|nr:MAG: hypothetical protein DLM64_09310 [Solirubrobacterales bacterium]
MDPACSPYATPATIAQNLHNPLIGDYRRCYSWLGPNQPGVNEADPTAPSAKVPDPGGAPPGEAGPGTSASQLTAADVQASAGTGQAAGAGQASASARGSSSGAAGSPASEPAASNPPKGQAQQLLNYLLAP